MMKGIYSFVVCLALLFVIKSADLPREPAAAGTGLEVPTMAAAPVYRHLDARTAFLPILDKLFAVGAVASCADGALAVRRGPVVNRNRLRGPFDLHCEAAPTVRAPLDLWMARRVLGAPPPCRSRALSRASLPYAPHIEGIVAPRRDARGTLLR